ncbi:MAG: Gldg family protein [Verrucomicrobiota bacterium]
MKPISRIGTGSLAIIQLVLALIIFLSFTYLTTQFVKVGDFSKDRDFSLSDLSLKILAEPKLSNRESPLLLTVAVRKSSPHFERVRRVAQEFARKSNGHIQTIILDPIREPDAATRLASSHDLILNQDLLVLDARSPDASQPDPSLTKFIPLEDLILFRTDSNNQRRPVGYQIEDRISTALLSLAEGQPRKLYFLADKSPLDSSGPETPWDVLSDTLRRQNLLLVPIEIAQIVTIPTDAEGVVVVSPAYDFDDRELAILEEYFSRPGAAFFACLDPAHRPDRLRAFLRRHGITPNNDRILTVSNSRTLSRIPALFTTFEGTNEGLHGQATTFEGPTCSLSVREMAEDLASQNITPIILIQSAENYWGETRFRELGSLPSFDSSEDLKGNPGLPIAAASISGDATSDEAAAAASRMVVIANVHFLHPDRLREEQLDFVKNSINWLIGRENLVGVGPRGLRTYKLNLVSPEVSFLNRLNLFILPASLLFIGLLVWNNRRA